MPTWQPDRGEWLAIALGLAVAGALAWFLFGLVGWLGVGLVGLIGLVISSRVALDDGRAVPDSDFGATGVGIVARQIEQEHGMPPEQRAARWAEQDKRSAIIYFVNTIAIALAALGFALFAVHQLSPPVPARNLAASMSADRTRRNLQAGITAAGRADRAGGRRRRGRSGSAPSCAALR